VGESGTLMKKTRKASVPEIMKLRYAVKFNEQNIDVTKCNYLES
jgi:hypothetical protein